MLKSGQIKVDGLGKGNDAGPSEGKQRSAIIDKKPKKKGPQQSGPRNPLLDVDSTPAKADAAVEEKSTEAEAKAESPLQPTEPEAAVDAEEDDDVADAWDADSDDEDKAAKKEAAKKAADAPAPASAPSLVFTLNEIKAPYLPPSKETENSPSPKQIDGTDIIKPAIDMGLSEHNNRPIQAEILDKMGLAL